MHIQRVLNISNVQESREEDERAMRNCVRTQLEPVFGGHVGDQIDDALGVSPLVVVPGNKLDEVVVQGDTSLGIEDGRVSVANKVGRHNVVLGIVKDALLLCK
jgi:hypothetical protein